MALVVPEYVTERHTGGLANYTYRVATGLQSFGITAEIFFPGNIDEVFLHDGITVHRVSWGTGLLRRIIRKLVYLTRSESLNRILAIVLKNRALRCALKMRHLVSQFDIVQYSHLEGTGFWRINLPTVIRLSSYPDLWLPHGYQNTSSIERYLEDKALIRADGVFGPGRYVAEYVGKKLGIKTEVIESPFIPSEELDDANLFDQHLSGKKYALYFGALAEYKGVYILADAVDQFLLNYPGHHFVWVGTNRGRPKNGLYPLQNIKNRLQRHGDRVIYFDALKHAQLFPIVKGAEFVTTPSLAENFSNTSIEAMSLGKVLIGTNGRSFEQLIKDGYNGLLCEPGDVASLLTTMQKAADLSTTERIEMGDRAKERVLGLNPDKIVSQLIDYYSNIIATTSDKLA